MLSEEAMEERSFVKFFKRTFRSVPQAGLFDGRRRTLVTIARFEFFENVRNKWLVGYGLSFFLLGNLIVYLGGRNPLQASGSLLSLVLLVVPLFSLVFGSLSFTEALGFMELLAAQPVARRDLYLGKWFGLGTGLAAAFVLGMGGGSLLLINRAGPGFFAFFLLLLLGAQLSYLFTAVAFLLSNLSDRKEVVFGLVLAVWFFFFILHDLLILGTVILFGEYPLEPVILVLSAINPIDLVRVLLTLQLDLSALMGVTGAVFQKVFGGPGGAICGALMLLAWTVLPLWLGLRLFKKRNL